MATLLGGLLTWIITEISKKFKVSQTYVAFGLAIIGGTIYYIATNYYNVQFEQFVAFITGVYGTSQIVFNLINKRTKGADTELTK